MWTDELTGISRNRRVNDSGSDVEQVRQVQQTLWYVLTVIAVVEMVFGAWAVGLILR